MNSLDLLHTLPDSCANTRASFSSYLDGAVNGHEMQAIAAHLERCTGCTHEFAGWRAMQQTLVSLRTVKAPEDLGLRLRLAISHEHAAKHSNWRESAMLAWENTWRPLALQASAGLACAVTLVGAIVFLLGVVTPPSAVLADDEPLGAITQPHYLYSAVRPNPIVIQNAASTTIVVEALINSDGRVYDYTVVSAPEGPEAPAIQSQIEDQLLLAVFKPASVFGVPVKGRVILTFAGVSVHA